MYNFGDQGKRPIQCPTTTLIFWLTVFSEDNYTHYIWTVSFQATDRCLNSVSPNLYTTFFLKKYVKVASGNVFPYNS